MILKRKKLLSTNYYIGRIFIIAEKYVYMNGMCVVSYIMYRILARVDYPQSCTQWALSSRQFTTRSTSYRYLGACTSLQCKLATVYSTPSFSILWKSNLTERMIENEMKGERWKEINPRKRWTEQNEKAYENEEEKNLVFLKLIIIYTCIKLVPC